MFYFLCIIYFCYFLYCCKALLYNCFVCVEWGERRGFHLKCSRVNILKNEMARGVKYSLAHNMRQGKNSHSAVKKK